MPDLSPGNTGIWDLTRNHLLGLGAARFLFLSQPHRPQPSTSTNRSIQMKEKCGCGWKGWCGCVMAWVTIHRWISGHGRTSTLSLSYQSLWRSYPCPLVTATSSFSCFSWRLTSSNIIFIWYAGRPPKRKRNTGARLTATRRKVRLKVLPLPVIRYFLFLMAATTFIPKFTFFLPPPYPQQIFCSWGYWRSKKTRNLSCYSWIPK